MSERLLTWWEGREPRERLLLGVLGVLIAVFLLVFAIVLPIQSARSDATAQLNRAKSDLVAVSRLSGPSDRGAVRAPFDRSVLITVARAQGVKLTRVQPGSDNSLSVWIDDAQTDRLYGFFDALLSGYAANLDQVIVSADANGRLSAQFVVR